MTETDPNELFWYAVKPWLLHRKTISDDVLDNYRLLTLDMLKGVSLETSEEVIYTAECLGEYFLCHYLTGIPALLSPAIAHSILEGMLYTKDGVGRVLYEVVRDLQK